MNIPNEKYITPEKPKKPASQDLGLENLIVRAT